MHPKTSTALVAFLAGVFLLYTDPVTAQNPRDLYTQTRTFSLSGAKADVNNLVLKRDRVQMTFTGTFYFSSPFEGRVNGAVFIGNGTLHAEVPPTEFEKKNLKRLTGAEDAVDSDFKTAVFRFTDDTFDVIGKGRSDGQPTAVAQELASSLDDRILKETGANLSSRVALSILNHENPGFFFANYDGGRLGQFSYVFDYQNRIPTLYFGVNAGERGMFFKYRSETNENDIWMAFYALSDYAKGIATYADVNDLVDITNYDMNIDLRQPTKRLGLQTKIRMQTRQPDVRAVNFTIGENLSERDNERLKKQMRVRSASVYGSQLDVAQEDWESGFTVFFPKAIPNGGEIELSFELEGDFLRQPAMCQECSYPRSNSSWYPRHGYLDRSTFSYTFTHSSKLKVACTGTRVSEQPDPADKDLTVTKYAMNFPVALETFALGPFERHEQTIKWDNGDKPTPLEFSSLSTILLKESFVLTELNNSVRNFQFLFGKYPYDTFSAVYHPYSFGQGFATLLTIPNTDKDSKEEFAFMAHETAHQWWGNIVAWRSYRDQWLSEGFAEYSGVLYAGTRDGKKSSSQLIDQMRQSLKDPPATISGPYTGKGRLVDVGPIILGHRLDSRKTYGSYNTLVYNKGALVLRMIHFLLTDPESGSGDPFYAMMKDFVDHYRNKVASTDDFKRVASEHFAKSPIAAQFGLTDLNWFFREWVYDTTLPSYSLDYKLEPLGNGSVMLTGYVNQTNAPESWFMPLPVLIKFGENKFANVTVAAQGPRTPFQFKLPLKPQSVELDPHRWVLSEKTSTN